MLITPLDIIDTPGGNVMHAMKESSAGYLGFGEVYFSQVDKGIIKAWKRHKKMTLNLVVPVGKIRFVLFDNRKLTNGRFQEVIISKDNYCRLTIPPMVWLGFQGLSDETGFDLWPAKNVQAKIYKQTVSVSVQTFHFISMFVHY